MQASNVVLKGNLGFDLIRNPSFSQFKSRSNRNSNTLSVADRNSNSKRIGSVSMGVEVSRLGKNMFRSSVKPRFVTAQSSSSSSSGGGGDLEEAKPLQGKSTGTVLPYVGVACLGAILFGYHLGVVNGALEYLATELGIVENAVIQGWIVSTLLAGATVGSFTGGTLADKFGRTRTFQLDAIHLAVGAFLCATAQSVQTMIIGRLLAGIGIGISSALVPLYISEISPTEIRGALGSVNQLFICVGILAALVAGLPLAKNPLWWRTMFGIAVVPSILLALGMGVAPESPRWLFQIIRFYQWILSSGKRVQWILCLPVTSIVSISSEYGTSFGYHIIRNKERRVAFG